MIHASLQDAFIYLDFTELNIVNESYEKVCIMLEGCTIMVFEWCILVTYTHSNCVYHTSTCLHISELCMLCFNVTERGAVAWACLASRHKVL